MIKIKTFFILILLSNSCFGQVNEKLFKSKKIVIDNYLLNNEVIFRDTIVINHNFDTVIINRKLPLKVVEVSNVNKAILYSTDIVTFIIRNEQTKNARMYNQKKVNLNDSGETWSYPIDDIYLVDFNKDNENELVVKWNSWDEDFGLEVFQLTNGEYQSKLWTDIFSFSYEQNEKIKIMKNKIEVITCSNCEEGPRYEGSKVLKKQIVYHKGNYILK
jgi:hypothetical protein